jgi:PAS domain S-box-containing protein
MRTATLPDVNERMAHMLGASAADMVGQPSFDYVFPEDLEQAQRLFAVKRGGGMDPFEFRLRRKNGPGVWVEVQGTPMHDSEGVFVGIVGTFTERA